MFIFYLAKLRGVMRGEVSTEMFCLVVLGAGALLGLCLQFPMRWGRLNASSWLQDSTNVLSQWAGHTCQQRCDIIYLSFRKAPFSVFNNNSWNLTYSCEKKLSSLVYRFPQICCIHTSKMSTKFQLPAKQFRILDEGKDIEIPQRNNPVIFSCFDQSKSILRNTILNNMGWKIYY